MKLEDLQKGLKKRGIEVQIINATPNQNEMEEEIITHIEEDIEELSRFVGAKDWTMAAIINNRIQRKVRKMMEKSKMKGIRNADGEKKKAKEKPYGETDGIFNKGQESDT